MFSRYAEIIPVKEITSQETAAAFMSHVVKHWGVPEWVLSDGGSEFRLVFDDMCEQLTTHHRLSTPNYSKGHGMVEKMVQEVSHTLAHLLEDDDEHWYDMVPFAQLAYNAAPHKALSNKNTALSCWR